MFGEAFAAELGGEDGSSKATSINMGGLGANWTVGGDDSEFRASESEEDAIFSKYVFPAVKSSFMELDVFHSKHRSMTQEQWDEEDELNLWLKHHKASLNSSKLKSVVRRHIPPPVRARLWHEISGGSRFMSKVPNLYHDTCEKLFGKDGNLPESVNSCTLSNDEEFMSYYLTPDGVISLRKVLYVLSHLHPDITYCPILQQVGAVFLHFMEEVWCFACLSAMLTGKKMYFDQTHLQATAADYALYACAAAVLIRLVDCFLIEGPKVFFRTALFLLRLFYEYSLKFEKIELPCSVDLTLAIGKYSEALQIPADDFIKAILRIRIRNQQINTAIDKFISQEKSNPVALTESKEAERVISFDVSNISDIISPDQWRNIISWLPVRIQLLKPTLAFTSDEDGFSLKTLYNKVEEEDQTIIIIKTDKGEIFGAYLSMSLLHRKDSKKGLAYFGNGETFIFSVLPLMEKFSWTDIEEVDHGKTKVMEKQKSSFVFVDIKGSPRRKRRSFRITRRKVSVKLQGIPKNLSMADLPSQTAYGGIPKNSSVVHLHHYSKLGDTGYSSEHSSPLQRLRGISGTSTATTPSSVFTNVTPKTASTGKNSFKAAPGGNPAKYQHSMSENEAQEYPSITDDDVEPQNRVTRLPDDLCIVEKRLEFDEHDSGTSHPEHARHVKHAPSDLFIAGDNRCIIVGGG
eukprot:gene12152-2761_t